MQYVFATDFILHRFIFFSCSNYHFGNYDYFNFHDKPETRKTVGKEVRILLK